MSRFLAAAALSLLAMLAVPEAQTIDPCTGARDLRLTNGRIVTMDEQNRVVSEVTIQDGRFVALEPGMLRSG